MSEKINFLKNNLNKDTLEYEEKIQNPIEDIKETCVGYETPVKAPRPVTPTNESPGEYTDMNSKKLANP